MKVAVEGGNVLWKMATAANPNVMNLVNTEDQLGRYLGNDISLNVAPKPNLPNISNTKERCC